MRTIACSTAYGAGGIGQHLAQLVEEARAEGVLHRYYAPGIKDRDASGRRFRNNRWVQWLRRYTPVRFSPGWRTYVTSEWFDRRLASHLDETSRYFMGFAGNTLRSFRRARALGAERLELIAPNSHVDNIWRLHERACRHTGIHDTWLNDWLRRKTLAEYEEADVIYTHSDYVRQSFLNAGIPEGKLRNTRLEVHPRFQPPAALPEDDTFRVMYCGRVEATKGIPLLVEAFAQVAGPAQLTLVGGWSTRAMRKFMQRHMARDPRIRCAPGDPLPHLRRADVFVHPTFEEGFGYAPMEALACGVPVIATEDTGMKEHITEGEGGFVVPTGSVEALAEGMRQVREKPLAATRDLRSASKAAV